MMDKNQIREEHLTIMKALIRLEKLLIDLQPTINTAAPGGFPTIETKRPEIPKLLEELKRTKL
jgi:hypothetical protein